MAFYSSGKSYVRRIGRFLFVNLLCLNCIPFLIFHGFDMQVDISFFDIPNVRFNIKDREILVRKGSREDAIPYYALLRDLREDPDSFILVNYSREMPSLEDIKKRSEGWNVSPRYMHLATVDNGDNEIAGFVGSVIGPEYGPEIQPHIAEIYYGVSPKYRHTGMIYAMIYASMIDINVKYYTATAYIENKASIHVLESIGIMRIAKLVENDFYFRNKTYHDDYLFRGLRETALEKLPGKLADHHIKIID